MFSINLKKKLAVLLTGVMVLGMTTTAFADTKSGGSDGAGTFEGHANSTIVSVTLPTVSAGTTPFGYIYDPEGLIEGTQNKAYPGATFTGDYVYFETSDNVYTGTSKELTISNNSMVSINVTIKVQPETGGNDPALVSSNSAATSAKAASLYLGLKVGDKPVKPLNAGAVEVSVSLNGMPQNYTLSYNGTPHSYSYVKDETKTDWENIAFSIEGAANKVTNAKDLTAPTLKVTWEYEPVGDVEDEGTTPTGTPTQTPTETPGPSAPVLSQDYFDSTHKSVTITGATVSSVILNKKDGTNPTLNTSSHYTYNSSTGVLTIKSDGLITNNKGCTITLNYSDYAGTSVLELK